MKILKNILLVTIICQLAFGCAIQKRRYTKGYYVSTRSKSRQTKNFAFATQSNKEKKIDQLVMSSPVLLAPLEAVDDLPAKIRGQQLSVSTQNFAIHSRLQPLKKTFVLLRKDSKAKNLKQASGTGGSLNIAALVGFILSLLMIPMLLAAISVLQAGAYAGILILIMAIALAVLAFIVSLIGIIIKLANSSKRGTWLAIAGLIISGSLILAAILIFF